uniref:Girdin-like n=1 Tax=Caenorhabditis tropicalis TaxID=1561998 RepID=A0A1I7V1K2_9PELO
MSIPEYTWPNRTKINPEKSVLEQQQETIENLMSVNSQQSIKIRNLEMELESKEMDLQMSSGYCNLMQEEYNKLEVENERLNRELKRCQEEHYRTSPAIQPIETSDPFQAACNLHQQNFSRYRLFFAKYNLRCYLFDPEGEKVLPQMVMNAKNPCNFYQNQRSIIRKYRTWTDLTEEEKGPWKEDWMKMKRLQNEQIRMGWCQYRTPPVTPEDKKRLKRNMNFS